MSDYYQHHYQVYHARTFWVDPSSFLDPLTIHLKSGNTVVDVGCGSGRDILWLKSRGYDVIGLERSSGLAGLARAHTACRIIEADFETYDFSRLSVDAIMLIGALVHLPHTKISDVLNSINRALKDDGNILLSLKKGAGNTSDSHGRVYYLWNDGELRDLFEGLGLDVIDYFQQSSTIGTDEVWIGYVLEKAGH